MRKRVMESVNSHRNGQAYQLAEMIMTLNLLPGPVVTVGMISFRYHAGRLNSLSFLGPRPCLTLTSSL